MSTTEIAKTESKPEGIRAMLTSEAYKKQFAMALPRHLPPDRFVRICLTAITRNPKLLDCTPASFMRCAMDLSAMGLEPDGRKAHLIPYRDNRNNVTECTLIVDYKGKVEMVRRDESVVDVQCLTICEHDECEWVNGSMIHKINPKIDRGEVVSTYTRIEWKNGSVSVGEPFSKRDAEQAKRSSKSSNNGPWVNNYVEMWKKSNVHRDSKMWPLSSEVQEAMSREDSHFQADMKAVTGRVVVDNPMLTPPVPQAFDDLPASPAPEPMPTNDDAERKTLISEIKATLADNDSTIAKFAPLCRKAGLLADGVSLPDAPIDLLRAIHDNHLAILTATYSPA